MKIITLSVDISILSGKSSMNPFKIEQASPTQN